MRSIGFGYVGDDAREGQPGVTDIAYTEGGGPSGGSGYTGGGGRALPGAWFGLEKTVQDILMVDAPSGGKKLSPVKIAIVAAVVVGALSLFGVSVFGGKKKRRKLKPGQRRWKSTSGQTYTFTPRRNPRRRRRRPRGRRFSRRVR